MPEILDALISSYAQAALEELTVPDGEALNDKEFLDGYVQGFKSGYAEFIYEFEMLTVENPTWSFNQGFSIGEHKGQSEGWKQQMNEDLCTDMLCGSAP